MKIDKAYANTTDSSQTVKKTGHGLHCLPITHYILDTTSDRKLHLFYFYGNRDKELRCQSI